MAGFRIAASLNAPARLPAIDPLALVQLFAPGIAAAQQDPRALLVWQPLARLARQLHPEAFAAIERASGATFPFTSEHIEAAHAQWTADWLVWERSHDAEFKVKTAALAQQLAGDSAPAARARLDEVEREKLERYQRRYQEYVRVAKALQSLAR